MFCVCECGGSLCFHLLFRFLDSVRLLPIYSLNIRLQFATTPGMWFGDEKQSRAVVYLLIIKKKFLGILGYAQYIIIHFGCLSGWFLVSLKSSLLTRQDAASKAKQLRNALLWRFAHSKPSLLGCLCVVVAMVTSGCFRRRRFGKFGKEAKNK